MSDDRTPKDGDAVESLLTAARSRPPAPTADFMARLVADADAASAEIAWASPEPAPVPSPLEHAARWWIASGLAGTAAIGVWIGFAMPDVLNTLPILDQSGDSFELAEFLPGSDFASFAEPGADG